MSSYHLGVYLSDACPLQCDYCYVSKEGQTLPFEKFKKGADLFLWLDRKNCKPQKSIVFLGGEPLATWSLLKRSILYLKNHRLFDPTYFISVFTNGVLLDENKLSFLEEKGIKLAISIDGKKISHDSQRRFQKNRRNGSFDAILKNIGAFSSAFKKATTVSMVISPSTSLKINQNLAFIRKLGFTKIDFFPTCTRWKKRDLTILKKSFLNFINYYIDLFRKADENRVFHIPWLYQSVLNQKPCEEKFSQCGELRLSPEGNFYICDRFLWAPKKNREKWKIGDVEHGISLPVRRRNLQKASLFFQHHFPDYKKQFFCPFSIYFWDQIGKDTELKENLLTSFFISDLFSSARRRIFAQLKNNMLFRETYHLGPLDYGSKNTAS